MTRNFGPFEVLWRFVGPTYNEGTFVHYYGIAVGFLFIGFVFVSPRKDSNGSQV